MTVVEKVLVALDGSEAAATALPLARVVAAQLGASVEILHVASAEAPTTDLWRRLHLDLASSEGVQVRSHVGEPAPAILRAAAQPDVALLALTTHGRLLDRRRHLGRVAEAVVAHAARPILLVRPEAAPRPGAERPLTHLLLPLDGTPTTAAALGPATDLAGRLRAAIDVLYVASPVAARPGEPGTLSAPGYVDQPHHEWPEWAREVMDRLCTCLAHVPAGVPVRVYLARGEIEEQIATFARAHDERAIVLVRRSHLELGHARVLRAVLDRTPCPVLLVGSPSEVPPG